eukprot:Gb_30868 [translate_table: standard]
MRAGRLLLESRHWRTWEGSPGTVPHRLNSGRRQIRCCRCICSQMEHKREELVKCVDIIVGNPVELEKKKAAIRAAGLAKLQKCMSLAAYSTDVSLAMDSKGRIPLRCGSEYKLQEY